MILNNIEIQDLQSRHSSQDKHIFLYIVVEGMIPVTINVSSMWFQSIGVLMKDNLSIVEFFYDISIHFE
jgi:hypothetical protein